MPRVNGYFAGSGTGAPSSCARDTGLSARPLSVVDAEAWSDLGLGAGLAIRFHELGQDAADALGMHEPDQGAMRSGAGHFVQQLPTPGGGPGQRGANVTGRKGHVMDGLTAVLQELLDLRLGGQRCDQLDPAFSDRDHGDLDAFILEPLPAAGTQPKSPLIDRDRLIEVADC